MTNFCQEFLLPKFVWVVLDKDPGISVGVPLWGKEPEIASQLCPYSEVMP